MWFELCAWRKTVCYSRRHHLYPITEINSTYQGNDIPGSNSEEDVLYQRGASFSAELDVNSSSGNLFDAKKLPDTVVVYTKNGREPSLDDNSKSDYDDDKGKGFTHFLFHLFRHSCPPVRAGRA